MLQLSKREKLLIKGLIAVVSVAAAYFLLISSLMELRTSINSTYDQNVARISTLQRIHEEYQQIRLKRSQYESQIQSGQGITTLIEENAKNLKILGNKSYVRVIPGTVKDNYKKVSAEVKFVGIDVVTAIKFIYDMEHSSSLVRTSYIRVSEALKGRDIYDVEIKFDNITSH